MRPMPPAVSSNYVLLGSSFARRAAASCVAAAVPQASLDLENQEDACSMCVAAPAGYPLQSNWTPVLWISYAPLRLVIDEEDMHGGGCGCGAQELAAATAIVWLDDESNHDSSLDLAMLVREPDIPPIVCLKLRRELDVYERQRPTAECDVASGRIRVPCVDFPALPECALVHSEFATTVPNCSGVDETVAPELLAPAGPSPSRCVQWGRELIDFLRSSVAARVSENCLDVRVAPHGSSEALGPEAAPLLLGAAEAAAWKRSVTFCTGGWKQFFAVLGVPPNDAALADLPLMPAGTPFTHTTALAALRALAERREGGRGGPPLGLVHRCRGLVWGFVQRFGHRLREPHLAPTPLRELSSMPPLMDRRTSMLAIACLRRAVGARDVVMDDACMYLRGVPGFATVALTPDNVTSLVPPELQHEWVPVLTHILDAAGSDRESRVDALIRRLDEYEPLKRWLLFSWLFLVSPRCHESVANSSFSYTSRARDVSIVLV